MLNTHRQCQEWLAIRIRSAIGSIEPLAVTGMADSGLQLIQRRRHYDGDRKTLVPAQFRISELTTNQRGQRVVLALTVTR